MPRKYPSDAPNVAEITVEELVEATIDRNDDFEDTLKNMSDETLAAVAENINTEIEMVAGYTRSWTVRDGLATYDVSDTGVWREPIEEIIEEDPALNDFSSPATEYLAKDLFYAAFYVTGPSSADSGKLTTRYSGPTETEV